MDLIQAKSVLCRLLSCNIDEMDLVDLKILVRRRKLLWHPDKNTDKNSPNEYSAIYTEAEPDLFCSESQPDLFCSESTLPPSPGPSNVSDPLEDALLPNRTRFLFLDHNLIREPPFFLLESLEFLTNNAWTCD
ncbi:hypothetical protein CEXT_435191 [Caerostris extrusa]|uniref:J domain-containing protein n=1 Tax=Caerostris extrusa TaxID=172846 RepID=A0AAV4SNN4_CAEEX|nr:hypothetical protein CEXT_435191 [Caerostris extrusa]